MYRIDGALVAMSVLDILPNCVCSAYFLYDPRWEMFSLGKLSVFREVALAKEMHAAGAVDIQWLYLGMWNLQLVTGQHLLRSDDDVLGYYVHSCAKSRYKGEYTPSYLADPEEHSWHRLEDCMPLLVENRYACFAHPERSIKGKYEGPRACFINICIPHFFNQDPLFFSAIIPNVPDDLLAKAYYIENDLRTQQLVAAPITVAESLTPHLGMCINWGLPRSDSTGLRSIPYIATRCTHDTWSFGR